MDLVWDKSNTNDWTASSLKSLLNGAYYKAQDGTSSGYCYGYSTTVTANCDYTKKGIQSGYRGMIANVTWHLGGYSSTSATSSAFYGYERGTKVYMDIVCYQVVVQEQQIQVLMVQPVQDKVGYMEKEMNGH